MAAPVFIRTAEPASPAAIQAIEQEYGFTLPDDYKAHLLRYNGVGPVASAEVLDACDEGGLLIWQELPLTSSGTDNVPPQHPAFLAHLERDLPALVRHLRCHPSVALLGGGNELTDERRALLEFTRRVIA